MTRVKRENGIYILTVEGTPYERGYTHGKELKEVIEKGFSQWAGFVKEITKEDLNKVVNDFLDQTNMMESIEKYVPHLLEELRGIADGSGIALKELYAYHLIDDFIGFLIENYNIGGEESAHCTTIALFNRKDDNVVAGNCDLTSYFDGTQTLLKVKYPDSDLEQLVFTFAGIIGQGGMNNKGVGLMINFLADANNQKEGLPSAFLVRGILEQESTDAAIDFLKRVPHSWGINYLFGDARKVASVECSKNEVAVVESYENNDFIVHTNHCLSNTDLNGMDAIGTQSDAAESFAKTKERLDTGLEMMLKIQDGTDVEKVKEVLSTEPINVAKNDLAFTVASIVVELDGANSRMHYAPGPPKTTEYSVFIF